MNNLPSTFNSRDQHGNTSGQIRTSNMMFSDSKSPCIQHVHQSTYKFTASSVEVSADVSLYLLTTMFWV